MWCVRNCCTLSIFPVRNIPIELITRCISFLFEVAIIIDHWIKCVVRAWLGNFEIKLIGYLLLFLCLLFQPISLSLQKLLTESICATSCQFTHVLKTINSATEHGGIDAGLGQCDLLSFVDKIKTSNNLLVSF